MQTHTDLRFEEELGRLMRSLLFMGAQVEANIREAVCSLSSDDRAAAGRVAEREHEINILEMSIDRLCLVILALRQPVASDLRFVTVALKIVTDLERIGDLTRQVGKLSGGLRRRVASGPIQDVLEMASITEEMVKHALDGFVQGDGEQAAAVVRRDKAVDRLNEQARGAVLALMDRGEQEPGPGVDMILVARHLERIGDHAKNIAEMVIFAIDGRDVRHSKSVAKLGR